jgi:2-iminobutanoate/2-iminopropanoate deaminase
MTNHPVQSPDAPAAIGPYSQAIECKPTRLLFLSGQIPLDPRTGAMVEGPTADQARQVLANLDAVLRAGGMDRWNVVRTTIFLADLSDFAAVNEVYGAFFGEHRPARVTVQAAALPRGAKVEIDAIAAA